MLILHTGSSNHLAKLSSRQVCPVHGCNRYLLKTFAARPQDDPSLHDGRIRTVPHVEGQWPVHIFLERKWKVSLPSACSDAGSYSESPCRAIENSSTNCERPYIHFCSARIPTLLPRWAESTSEPLAPSVRLYRPTSKLCINYKASSTRL